MAKLEKNAHNEQEGKETVEFFKDLDREALNTERFLEKYSKQIGIVFGVLILGVLGFFGYKQFVEAPKNVEAVKSYLAAQKYAAEGKDKEALGGKSAANPGFLGTYENYSGTKVGKLSAYNAGLLKFKEGKFQEAYDLLDKFSSDNKTLMAMKYGAMADAKSGLNKNDEALTLLDKAASASDDPYTSYYFTRKAGIVALGLKKNAEAKKYFATIDEKYQDYDNGMSDSYIEMTKYY
ncbi:MULTISPECIES: tetratricopeptide repeat protein [unclassified Chryseobacterium]|uniref:tetratricopeptide repeat protein n=1 Tax=unclassified Chryseobacterium TaxID=2593645 RepID=UPI0012C7E1ED|nr:MULTISPECIES: tetratricopeptide repeat protein [unclassified Chryseobacterium]MPS64029.1 tetratricopeptide repeat protein [Chryseobacterium sp.]UMQ40412.1 tetratricopeptide repeat protein [Chryseobacterium sp. Y16C]